MTEAQLLALKYKLKAEAAKKFPHDPDRQNRYVWGTIQRMKKHE